MHGTGERADLVGGVDIEFVAGKITRGDGVGAVGYEVDAASDAPGEEKREDASDERAENGGGPQGDEDGAIGLLQSVHIGIALLLLGLDEDSHGGEQGGVQGKNLRLQENASLT